MGTRHWFWCRVTRGDEEIDTNKDRVDSILTAHNLGCDASFSKPEEGLYLVLMPEFPDSIEVVELEMGVGELTVSIV